MVCSFNMELLQAYGVPGPGLGAGDSEVKKAGTCPCGDGSGEERRIINKQSKQMECVCVKLQIVVRTEMGKGRKGESLWGVTLGQEREQGCEERGQERRLAEARMRTCAHTATRPCLIPPPWPTVSAAQLVPQGLAGRQPVLHAPVSPARS